MNFTKSILSLVLASSLFISCKDMSSKPTENKEANVEKKITAAVKPETASFKIDGMTCAIGCAKTIEEKLSKMNGVQKATVDFDKKQATVDFDSSILTPQKITAIVESCADGETYKVSEIKIKGKV